MAFGKGGGNKGGGNKGGGSIGTRVRQAVTKGKDKKKEKEALKSPKEPRPKVQAYEAKKAANKEKKEARRKEVTANFDPAAQTTAGISEQQRQKTLNRNAERQRKADELV